MKKIIDNWALELILLLMVLFYIWSECFMVSDIGIAHVLSTGRYEFMSSHWLLLTLPLGIACIYKQIFAKRSIQGLVISSIWAITLIAKSLDAFFYRKLEENEYITKTIHYILSTSKSWGSSLSEEDIRQALPLYKSSYAFINIIAQHGIMTGLILTTTIAAVLIYLIVKCWRKRSIFSVISIASSITLLCMLIGNVFINLNIIPYFSAETFMPFVSVNFGAIITSWLLLGLALYGCKNVNSVETKNRSNIYR